MSRKAIAIKSLKEKWLSMVQSAKEKGEKGIGGSSTVTDTVQLIQRVKGCPMQMLMFIETDLFPGGKTIQKRPAINREADTA